MTRREPEESARQERRPQKETEQPASYKVPTELSDPEKGPQKREEVLAYVDGKLKIKGDYAIEGDTIEDKSKRLIAVDPNLRQIYFKDGDPKVTEKTLETLKKLFEEVKQYIIDIALSRRKNIQEKSDTENALPKDSKLKEDTTIIVSQKGTTGAFNKAGWLGEVNQDDKVDFLDDGRVAKIKGEDYVLCEVEHKLGKNKDEGTRKYSGYIKADKFDKKYIKAPAGKPDETPEEPPDSEVIELTDKTFEKEVLKSDKPVIVDFYAPWCGPCKDMAPDIAALSVRYKDKWKFAKLNGDKYEALLKTYGITSYPTLVIFKDGEVLHKIVGRTSKAYIKKTLDTVINKREKPPDPLPPSSTKIEDVKLATAFMKTVSIESGNIETRDDGKTITIKLKDSIITMDISGDKNKIPFTISKPTSKITGTFEKTATGHTVSIHSPKDNAKVLLSISDEKTAKFYPATGTPTEIAATDPADLIGKLKALGKTHPAELKDVLELIGIKDETVKPAPKLPETNTSEVLLMGDSITVGMKDHFPGALKAYEGKKQTSWMREQLDTFLTERKTGKHSNIKTLVIGGGFNDLTSTVKYEKIIENLEYIYENAKAAGLNVVAWTIPDWDYAKKHEKLVKTWKDNKWGRPPGIYPYKTPNDLKVETEKINAWIKGQAGKNVHVVIDVYDKGFERRDDIHRTTKGSTDMAAYIQAQGNITKPGAKPAPAARPAAAAISAPTVPIETPTAALQKGIEEIANRIKCKVTFYIFNTKTGECIARMNEKKPVAAASLIKLPILFALYKAVRDNKVKKDDMQNLMKDAKDMITKSRNNSTNKIIKHLGMKYIAKTIKNLGLENTKLNRLMLEKVPPAKENWTTAEDMAKAMTLATTIKPPDGWPSAMDLMLESKQDVKLGKLLPKNVKIARKGGELSHHKHDAAIFDINGKKFAAVVMVSNVSTSNRDRQQVNDETAKIGKLIYDTMNSDSK